MTKTIIQSILLFVAIVGSYSFYQQWNAYQALQEAEAEAYRQSFTGTHIMGNGDVMKPDGTVLSEARIRADGMIELPDDLVIEPAFDLRPKEKDIGTEQENMTTEEIQQMMDMMEPETDESEGEPTSQIQPNTDGTHIMANGDVMRGDGTVLPDATILEDGNIELEDGTIIEPVFDMRP